MDLTACPNRIAFKRRPVQSQPKLVFTLGPSTRSPALAEDSPSGFRPTGAVEGAKGLPVGLHETLLPSDVNNPFRIYRTRDK